MIENGGGYDDFMDTMLSASGNTAPPCSTPSTSSGSTPPSANSTSTSGIDYPTVIRCVRRDRDRARQPRAPAHAEPLRGQRRDSSAAGIDELEAARRRHRGGARGRRESPSPSRCRSTCSTTAGLVNRTPAEFSEAIEDDTDVAPAVLQADPRALLRSRAVVVLAYNAQTGGRRPMP